MVVGPPELWSQAALIVDTLLKVAAERGWVAEVLVWEVFCVLDMVGHFVDKVGYLWLRGNLSNCMW